MAKKKANNQEKTTQQHQDQTHHETPPMEDPSEKLQNLKELNSRLLLQAVEHRKLVLSLQQSKEALESELPRFGMEKKVLDDELKQLREQTMGFELEKSVMGLFVETQMNEWRGEGEKMKSEVEAFRQKVEQVLGDLENQRMLLGNVSSEKDGMRSERDTLAEEASRLRLQIVELEGREKKREEEVCVLEMECEKLIEKSDGKDKSIMSLKVEKEMVERKLAESVSLNDDLKAKIEALVRDKEGVERERNAQMLLLNGLKKEVGELKENHRAILKEEEELRLKVCVLEKNLAEAEQKLEKLEIGNSILVAEKEEMEQRLRILMDEKVSTMNDLKDSQKQLECQKQTEEKIHREKNAIEEAWVKQEREFLQLQKDMAGLLDDLSKLEKKLGELEENNQKLISEATHYRDAFDRITVERDDVKKGFDDEKKSGDDLKKKVKEMEKYNEETFKELEQMKKDHEKLIGEKKELESIHKMSMEEKASEQKNLLEAQQEIDEMQGKVKSMLANSELALSMLKNTAALVSLQDFKIENQEEGVDEQNTEEEIQSFAAMLEAIKNAIKSRDTDIEDMKRQLDITQKSEAEARRKSNFWTMMSSVTTIFAAASVAYAARSH